MLRWSKQQSKQELAAEQEAKGKEALLKAANSYGSEAEIYDDARGIFLAERARSNKEWCKLLVNGQAGQSSLLTLGLSRKAGNA